MGRRRPDPSPAGEGGLARQREPGGVPGRAVPTPVHASRDSPSPAGEGSGRSSPRAASIILAEFGRPHGLAGEVRLKSATAEPEAVMRYGPLTVSDGRTVVIASVRPVPGGSPDMLVARVEGIATREAAERLNRLTLSCPRERLAPPDEDEFYLADLIGLRAEAPDGFRGEVVAVPDYGSGELLEIRPAGGGRTALLPFTKAHVPVVDVAGGRVEIDPPGGWLGEAGDGR